jgi:TonB family protein
MRTTSHRREKIVYLIITFNDHIMKPSILLFFILLSSLGLTAQQPRSQSPEYKAQSDVNFLKLSLRLTDQQTERVMQIYVDHYKSTDSLRNIILKRGPNLETINSALTSMHLALQLETDKKISSVLNDDQKVAYTKLLSSRKMGELVTVSPVIPIQTGNTQDTTVLSPDRVQVRPRFPGGLEAWGRFMQQYQYPAEALKNKASGKAVVSFVVEKNGTLSSFRILQDPGYGMAEAAIQLLKRSPHWSPGVTNGLPVRVAITQPFELEAR